MIARVRDLLEKPAKFSFFVPKIVVEVPLEVREEKIEAAVALEKVSRLCYQTLAELIPNGGIRIRFLALCKASLFNQDQLLGMLKDPDVSRIRIEEKVLAWHLNPLSLSVSGVLTAALRSCLQKSSIYRRLARKVSGRVEVFEAAYQRTLKEIQFLKSEQRFQKKKAQMSSDWQLVVEMLS